MNEMGEKGLGNVLEKRLSRRTLLRRGGQVAGLAGVGAFLAACSGSAATSAPTQAAAAATTAAGTAAPATAAPSAAASAAPPSEGPMGTILNFANWPAYIDVATSGPDNGKSPTLLQFEKATGVKVNYQEKIDDNNSFVATIRDQLKAGLDTGWDLMVLTDWMAARLISLGWISKINQVNVAELPGEPGRLAPQPAVGPAQRLPLHLAVGHDRAGLQQEVGGKGGHAAAHEAGRPLEQQARRPRDVPDRDARYVRAGRAQAGDRPGRPSRSTR